MYIAGRSDDVLIVAGRNIDARAMDALVAAHPACRPGNTACVPDGSGRYVVVAEPRTEAMGSAELRAGAARSRVSLARRFAASPSAVVFIARGTLPKTPSGKVRRNHSSRAVVRGQARNRLPPAEGPLPLRTPSSRRDHGAEKSAGPVRKVP